MDSYCKFKYLLNACRGSVSLKINEHKDCYDTVKEYLVDSSDISTIREIPADVKQKMIETDTIIECYFYPNTSVGFYCVYHYDLDKCLDQCLELLCIREPEAPPVEAKGHLPGILEVFCESINNAAIAAGALEGSGFDPFGFRHLDPRKDIEPIENVPSRKDVIVFILCIVFFWGLFFTALIWGLS